MCFKIDWGNFGSDVLAGIIVGICLLVGTHYYLDSLFNPTPAILVSCEKIDNGMLRLNLVNPSSSVAEDVNVMVKNLYRGGSLSYIATDLCNMSNHPLLPAEATKIVCKYIPPKSEISLDLTTEENFSGNIGYSLWGKTTPQVEFVEVNCSS